MKSAIQTALFLLISASLFAQPEYHHFIRPGAYWDYKLEIYNGNDVREEIYRYFIEDSGTYVHGLNYHRILFHAPQTGLPPIDSIGWMAEDTTTGQVFYTWDLSNPGMKLYDFSLEVGDTLFGDSLSMGIYTIDHIDTITLFNGGKRRVWSAKLMHAFPTNYYYYVESFGSMHIGPFFHPIGSTHGWYTTLCVGENGDSLYGPECGIQNFSVSENPFPNFKLYPNPAKEVVTMDFGKRLTEPHEIKIFTLSGSLVYVQKISSGSNARIDVSAFNPSIYITEITNTEKVVRRDKFVVN